MTDDTEPIEQPVKPAEAEDDPGGPDVKTDPVPEDVETVGDPAADAVTEG